MITKQQIDTLLSIVEPKNEQEQKLLKCVKYDLYKCVDEVEKANKMLTDSKDGKIYLENLQLKSERFELKNAITDYQYNIRDLEEKLRKTKIKLRMSNAKLKENPDFRYLAKTIKWYMDQWED